VKESEAENYKSYRESLVLGRRAAHHEYDKAVLALSGAGLVLSITFIKDVVPIDRVVDLPILYVSWWLFAVSMVSTVISFLVGQLAFDYQIRLTDEYYVNKDEAAYSRRNTFALATRCLNVISCTGLVSALLLTVLFASFNLSEMRALHGHSPVTHPHQPIDRTK
jgi:hypothetical protein